MRKLLNKLRLWLLNKLHAVPEEDYAAICCDALRLKNELDTEIREHLRLISRFGHAVQEICRRSENSYYNWCCEYCCARDEECKTSGWCKKFWPAKIKNND